MTDETTRRAPPTSHPTRQEALALTVLAHPDPARVGDVHVAEGDRAEVGRKAPMFVGADGREQPLADAFVSRRPIELVLGRDGLHVRTTGDGTPLTLEGVAVKTTIVPLARLEPGVVVVLADRIALLVHRRAPPPWPRPDDLGLVGESAAIEATRVQIRAAASIDAPVLVRGESGSGKELVVRALVALGQRRGPLVVVNVAALASTLAASELFGHEKGAFTGATQARDGAFARADGGTLFLDEIGDVPTEVQALLLRALETGEIQPVGASRSRHVDVRVVAATDAPVESDDGRFKAALLHRLAGYRIDVPPLRARRDDVARLLHAFVRADLGPRAWPGTDARPWLPAPLVARLARYPWPGNVRQLRNVARAIALQADAPEVSMEALRGALVGLDDAEPPQSVTFEATKRRASEIADGELLESLERHGFRLGAVARALGVSRPSLYDRIEKCTLVRKAREVEIPELERELRTHDGDVNKTAEALRVSPRALLLRLRELGIGG